MTSADAISPASNVPLDKALYGASFGQAVVRVFRKYAVFSGRASRSEFWWATLFFFLGAVVLLVPGIVIGYATGTPYLDPRTGRSGTAPGPAFVIFLVAYLVFYLAILVPSIAVAVRRLHDANFSGALYLLVFLGGIGSIILLVLTALESNPAGARFDAGNQPYTGAQPPPPITPSP